MGLRFTNDRVQVLDGHHCIVALDKLLTPTHMHLSLSNIIWYWPRGVISLAGKVTAGLLESNGRQTDATKHITMPHLRVVKTQPWQNICIIQLLIALFTILRHCSMLTSTCSSPTVNRTPTFILLRFLLSFPISAGWSWGFCTTRLRPGPRNSHLLVMQTHYILPFDMHKLTISRTEKFWKSFIPYSIARY